MKIRVRIEGPNKRGMYRVLLVVDGKRKGQSHWMSEAEAFGKLDQMREALLDSATASQPKE